MLSIQNGQNGGFWEFINRKAMGRAFLKIYKGRCFIMEICGYRPNHPPEFSGQAGLRPPLLTKGGEFADAREAQISNFQFQITNHKFQITNHNLLIFNILIYKTYAISKRNQRQPGGAAKINQGTPGRYSHHALRVHQSQFFGSSYRY